MARINTNNSSHSNLGLLPRSLNECSLENKKGMQQTVGPTASWTPSPRHLFVEAPRYTTSQDKIKLFL